MRWFEKISLFVMGGAAYLAAEVAWRGVTHWTMFFAGGISFCCLAWLGAKPGLPVLLGAAIGAAGISALELFGGALCTQLLKVRVWDYSAEWGNLFGYVCPKYTMLWYILCLWLLISMRAVRWPARLKMRLKSPCNGTPD